MTDVKTDLHTVLFVKDDPDAVIPTKGTPFSVGYDLTAIRVHKRIPGGKTTIYDTGIKIQPPVGYYTKIYPRSSLSKTGYMLSNSVGVIDEDFSDRLLISLTKIDPGMPDITLPFTRCQLVLCKAEYFQMERVDSITDTGRGSFGSTDK